MIVFFGTYDKVLEALDRHLPVDIVISQKGRLRNMRLQQRLVRRGVQWHELRNKNDFQSLLSSLPEFDVGAVAGFSYTLPQTMINRCRVLINFHPGDLLCCRGPQPIAAALYHAHETLGACSHLIDSEALDAGPILARDLIAVDSSRGYTWHSRQLMQLLERQAENLFAALAQGSTLPEQAWDLSRSRYYERLEPELLKKLYSAPSVGSISGLEDS